MFVVGSAQRILRGTLATLSWQGRDSDGEPADPGTVTVGVTRSDGTEVIAAGTATTGTGTDPRTVGLSIAQTAQLDVLYATWTVSGTAIATTRHDVVGGYYFDAGALRRDEPTLMDTSVGGTGGAPTAADIRQARSYVETFIEHATGVAFVPRFDAVEVTGSKRCELLLPCWWLRRVRWLRLWSSNSTYTAFTTDQCASIPANEDGIMRLDLSTTGYRVQVGVEHGADTPLDDVTREAIVFARRQLVRSRRGVPEEATSMRMQDGGFVTLATPGTGQWHSGIPSVDEMIKRRRRRETQLA